jgi:branched-chain amino acid transport system substrate-binding protein
MKEMLKTISILLVFCSLLLGLGSPAYSQVKEVVIGSLYPLSGINANLGIESKQAIELAVDIINNKYDLNLPLARTEGLPNLGGAKLKIIFADHENNPQKAMVETERLIIQEKVVAIYASYGSSVTATSSQVSERYQMPHLCPNASSPSLTKRGFKWFFRSCPDEVQFIENTFRFLKDMRDIKKKNIKRIAMAHENTLWGTDSAKVCLELAPKYGFEMVKIIPYDAKTTDLTTEVQLIRSQNPDALIAASYIPDAILFMKTFKELNYLPPMIVALDAGWNQHEFMSTAGRDSEFIVSCAGWSADLGQTKGLAKTVNELYKKRTGHDFADDPAKAFQGVFILADAINRAGSINNEAIRKALISTNIPGDQLITAWNGVRFDENQHLVGGKDLSVQCQIDKDVQYKVVWPFEYAVKNVIWPMPKWNERKK